MTRCVQDFVALGSENCNAVSVCLSSGSWIISSLLKIDFPAIFVLNLIQQKPHRAPMLLYDTIWRLSMRLSVRFGMMCSKYRHPNELKFSSRFFSNSTDGRKSQSKVYAELAAVNHLSFNKTSVLVDFCLLYKFLPPPPLWISVPPPL